MNIASERDVVKQNKIKWKNANMSFKSKKMNSDQLKNSTWLIEIESQCCFEWRRTKAKSKNWMSLIENSIQFYEQIQLNWERKHVDLGFFNRFQEIRFQIDEQREEFKEKVNDIALAMIDETKKYEAIYLNNLKGETLWAFVIWRYNKALVESNSNEIVETSSFRNSIESK